MHDHLWEHGLLMLVGVLLGVWFSEALSWLKRWVHSENWFLVTAALLLLTLYVPRSRRFLRTRGPRGTIRGWHIQGETIRAKILEEPDAKTEAERGAQKDRWWTMIRGTGTRYGWDQLAAI